MQFFLLTGGRGRYWPSLAMYHESSMDPWARNTIFRYGRCGLPMHAHEPPSCQDAHSSLYGALREAGGVRDGLMTDLDHLLPPTGGLAPEMQIDKECRGRAVVSNQI